MLRSICSILTIIIALFESTSPTTALTAQDYCSMTNVCPNESSVACLFKTSAAIQCSNGILLTPLKTNIVAWHNIKRNAIALGELVGYKPAARMGKMSWSNQLEQMAKYNVMRCVAGHDTCRNTNSFPNTGQNVYEELYSGPPKSIDQVAYAAVDHWHSVYRNANMNVINSYYVTSLPSESFTTMIKFNSNLIGCAGLQYNDGELTRVLFTCNYASTSIVTEPIYISGSPGSKCKKGKDIIYSGLCSVNEVFSH